MKIPIILHASIGAAQLQFARYPAIYNGSAPASRAVPTTMDAMFVAALNNALKRNRAKKCAGIDQEKAFVESLHKFLGYWETDDHAMGNKTDRDTLVRLIEYQSVHQTMFMHSDQKSFPDDVVDNIRSVHHMATKDGGLLGANPRILDPLDIIFNDVCADTGEAKVPRRVQETVDVVLHGLEFNAEMGHQLAPPPDCECPGNPNAYPCGVTLKHWWDYEASLWMCDCHQWHGC